MVVWWAACSGGFLGRIHSAKQHRRPVRWACSNFNPCYSVRGSAGKEAFADTCDRHKNGQLSLKRLRPCELRHAHPSFPHRQNPRSNERSAASTSQNLHGFISHQPLPQRMKLSVPREYPGS